MQKVGFVLLFFIITPAGRLILASGVVTFIVSAVFRDELALYLKWGAVPLGMWFLWGLTVLLINPTHLRSHYRPLIVFLPIALALFILMGTVDASYFRLGENDEYLGGSVGNFIATYPLAFTEETTIFEVNRAVRIGSLLLIAGLLAYPRAFTLFYKYIALLITGIALLFRSIFGAGKSIVVGNAVNRARRETDQIENLRDELLSAYPNGQVRTEYEFSSAQKTPDPRFGNMAPTSRAGVENLHSRGESYAQTFPPSSYERANPPDLRTDVPDTASHLKTPGPNLREPDLFRESPSYGPLPGAAPPSVGYSLPATPRVQSGESSDASHTATRRTHHEKYPLGSIKPVDAQKLERQGPKTWWKPPRESEPRVNPYEAGGDTQMTPSAIPTPSLILDEVQSESEFPAAMRQPSIQEERRSLSSRIKDFKETTMEAISGMSQPKIHATSPSLGGEPHREQRHQEFPGYWQLPEREMFDPPATGGVDEADLENTINQIESCFLEHGIEVKVDNVFPGPTVTKYGLTPGWRKNARSGGRVRVDDILGREKDLMLALAQPLLRFENVVPGEPMVGLEIPNPSPVLVNTRSVTDTDEWREFERTANLPIPLGIGSQGEPQFADLATMPHMLVAGATGSGKSVCINSIISGLLLTRTPDQVRFVLIDPKLVELTAYTDIPHLYTEVITEVPKVLSVLRALIAEMESRLHILREARARNILGYNMKNDEKMPYIVLVVDELSDLMITARADVEPLLVRLSQLARATGIHIILATQRPAVSVVTGEIKVNFPVRACFSVQSQPDSRTILDMSGGEKLLGNGDMLYAYAGSSKPKRIQGSFVSEEEIERLVNFWQSFPAPPLPQLDIETYAPHSEEPGFQSFDREESELFEVARQMTEGRRTISVSSFQTNLSIGFPRALRLMRRLEEAGVVSPGESGKARKVIGA